MCCYMKDLLEYDIVAIVLFCVKMNNIKGNNSIQKWDDYDHIKLIR